MSPLPLPTSPEPDFPGPPRFVSQTSVSLEGQPPNSTVLLTVLRNALAGGPYPPDAILRAIVDTARILTGANGTAIALQTDGTVICCARSGDLAPELGSLLNVDSGISGQCFRTAQPLRCDDARTDSRVEPEVCRILGIRSIAAVPIHGSMGTFGILEAFSSHAHAFTNEHIRCLKDLSEIAEAAHRQEAATKTLPPAQVGTALDRKSVV